MTFTLDETDRYALVNIATQVKTNLKNLLNFENCIILAQIRAFKLCRFRNYIYFK